MLLIGFGNKARQGKDVAAQAIKDYWDEQSSRSSLFQETSGVRGGIKVGVHKFATALYQEVNLALKSGILEHRRAYDLIVGWAPYGPNMLPDWVQPDLNAEVSELAPYGKHPKLLQWWGSDYRRKQDTNYWVNKLFDNIPEDEDISLVTDVRFPNEAEGIRSRGGYLVNIERLNSDGTRFVAPDRPADHISETALDSFDWDFKLVNSHNHQALLCEQAITLCEYLRVLGPSR